MTCGDAENPDIPGVFDPAQSLSVGASGSQAVAGFPWEHQDRGIPQQVRAVSAKHSNRRGMKGDRRRHRLGGRTPPTAVGGRLEAAVPKCSGHLYWIVYDTDFGS